MLSAMLCCVPILCGAALLSITAARAVTSGESPIATIGIAAALLGAIVVPTFRWLMARVDRQEAAQATLIDALKQSVQQSNDWRAETREVHRRLLERFEEGTKDQRDGRETAVARIEAAVKGLAEEVRRRNGGTNP